MVGCGDKSGSTVPASQVDAFDNETTAEWLGKDERGQICSLKLSADEGVASLELKGFYKVDYKIPTPGSGLYGVYYWEQTFSPVTHIIGEPRISTSSWRGGVVIEGQGKPLFWDGTDARHKLVIKPSLAHPKEVSYHTTHRVAGVIPMVIIDMKCRF
jgi:hypothetical protein